jgi:hypothetical protein
MTRWRPFKYLGFYDVPHMLVVPYDGTRQLLLDSPFDDARDDYDAVYTVSVIPADVDLSGSWSELPGAAMLVLGTVPVRDVVLDPRKRGFIDLDAPGLRELVATLTDLYRDSVQRALAATPVARNLATSRAVVLERIACGGGATSWYHCTDEASLHEIARRLLPGSAVSFYFDGRLGALASAGGARSRAAEVLVAVGEEIVVGALADDGLAIEVDFPSSAAEVDEFLSEHASARLYFVGEFPGRDDDGTHAVTVTIPDGDGVVRPHPH